MSDEFYEVNPETASPQPDITEQISEPFEQKESLLPGFKSICMRIGLMMIIVFASRGACMILSALMFPWFSGLSDLMQRLIDLVMSVVFLYVIPIISAMFILKHPIKNADHKVYGKPKYLGKALGMFPAGYGLAISLNILTMILGSLFQGTAVGDSFNATQEAFVAPDMTSALILFIQVTVIAPIFEELWFRGLVMESLRPYGNGFAIFVSAILFGMTHSNFAQFFYATALGIFLGYIAVSTKSVVTTTILHAMFNGMAGLMTLLSAEPSVQEYVMSAQNNTPAEITGPVVLYIVWLCTVMLLFVVGLIMGIIKLIKIKRYKVPKVQTEISAGKRWGIFFSRVTVIVMLLLAADSFTVNIIPIFIYKIITGGV